MNISPFRRSYRGLLLALSMLVIGALALSAFSDQSPWGALLLCIMAALFFTWALGNGETTSDGLLPCREEHTTFGLTGGVRCRLGGLLIGAGVITSLLSCRLFVVGAPNTRAWWFYGLSLLLFISGVLVSTKHRRRTPDLHNADQTLHGLAFVLIIVLAALLRSWDLDELPFGVWYDEAQGGLEARRWLAEPDHLPVFSPYTHSGSHLIMLYGAALRFISDSIQGMRLVSVLFGVGAVLAAYLFGREVKGPLLGLTMAFFVAVMRWHLNSSRIAMPGIDATFFVLVSLFFLARLLHRGHLRDAAFAGLAIGFGLSFYTAFRLFVIALGVFVPLGMAIWPQWRRRFSETRWWGRFGIRLGVFVLATGIAVMPMLQFAVRQPELFWSRVRTTSIFHNREEPELGRALADTLVKHIGMFHVSGDKNGRHNLPGEPMLDPLTGMLMIMGLCLAVRNRNDPSNLFFVILLPISLFGGIFSLDFEAPQAVRSVVALPVVAYLCALPVLYLSKAFKNRLPESNRVWWLAACGLAMAGIAGVNAHTYFVRQASDFAVWQAFSTAETLTGKKMAELGAEYDFYVSPYWKNHPSIRFLSPGTRGPNSLALPDAMPIRASADRPAAVFTHPDDYRVHQEARRIYPKATFKSLSRKAGEPPVYHLAVLSREDVASAQGLMLYYCAGPEKGCDQAPLRVEEVGTVDVDWSTAPPVRPPFVAEWQGILYAPRHGTYRLHLETSAKGSLEIDGEQVLTGGGHQRSDRRLAQGNHLFRLTVYAESGRERVRLSWEPPGQTRTPIPQNAFYRPPAATHNGLLGKYYPNPHWSGSPAFLRIDPVLDTYFHLTPLPRPYSVEWTGQIEVLSGGPYTLGIRSVGKAQLFIDGQSILITGISNQLVGAKISLAAGLHPIRVLYQDTLQRSGIHLLWTPPGDPSPVPIPARVLWPADGE